MKQHLTTEQKLAMKISGAVSGIMIILFVTFTLFLRLNLTKQKSEILEENRRKITEYLEKPGSTVQELEENFLELSWFVDFSIFDAAGQILTASNKFIPMLPQTKGKSVHHVEKNFFLDGNLDILYLTEQFEDNSVLQLSIDIENDSASKMIYSMPKIIPLMLIPIILLSYLVLLVFIRRDFEQEHNFSANVSHELQTPINAILGHAKLLERWGKEDPEQVEKSLGIIIAEAKAMQSTITNLLQITKLEKGMLDLTEETIMVDDFFAGLKAEFNYEKNLEIHYEPSDLQLKTNSALLHQIFVIAISNSLKFCPKPCKIQLSGKQERHSIILEICDNGKGFSPEILPHVFDRFYRGDEAHSRSKGGAGLGLSIAKSIAMALNCKIEASNATNGGASIKVIL